MTPARFQTIEQIFLAALEQEPNQVSAFLDTACDGDAVLRREVEVLLASDQRAGRFIEKSAVGLATKIIQNGQADSLVGQTIDHYEISESIGTGGMGEVYLATDIVAGRKAALKLLPMRFTGDAERLKRFQQEAHTVVGLNHPNILTAYEIGEDHSIHYIASELIEGETLRDRLKRGPMRLSEAVDIAIQVASALAAAHQTGIVHRDVKPENIMLRPDGYVKVLDFGIAKLAEQELPATMPRDEALLAVETNLGSILGTVRYMSSEQARGAPVDERSDIWSLGVVLYEMLTGHAPFTGDTPQDIMFSILEKEPPPLTRYVARAPGELQQIISKTLRKDRGQRYHNALELLQALKDFRRKLEAELERAAAPLWLRWARSPAALALILLVAALATGVATVFLVRVSRQKIISAAAGNIAPSAAAVTQLPEKSIAVLPFENLTKDEENAFFAGGVQDEILSNLAKIADLKVISRTSVMKYKSGLERNLREIAKALGVSYVVEGSVQRAGERVRVSAQLIDAENDANLWAEHYDRDIADIFAIQSEIAEQIAHQLQAKLSPAEKAAIAERPTADLAAYALYTKANQIDIYENWEGAEKSATQKVELLEKAVQRDPNFALAYCALAKTQSWLKGYLPSSGTGQHLELAKKAAEAALRVRPDLGEAHLELARYYFYAAIYTDPNEFDRARDELTIARRSLPNNSEAFLIAAKIDRHQNRWDSAVANLQKAVELDPRNREAEYWLETTYFEMRRYSEHEQLLTKDAAGGDPWTQSALGQIKLAQGDPVAAQSLLDQVPLDFSPTEDIWGTRFEAALYLRDYDAASRVIAATSGKWGGGAVAEGELARARGDKQKALTAFAAAREKLDATWGERPKDEIDYMKQVSEVDAGLGRKDQAIREAQRAVDLKPIAKDPLERTYSVVNLALVYAWTGERDRALEQLEIVAAIPAGPTYGDLRFNPCWDDLRGDPRFDKIVAAAKAASRYVVEPLPEKSIAVLPFENLSKDEENAFLAGGVQDEILTDLAKVADLKVISRTSLMQYKSGPERNVREIAKALGVSHVVEGSVQRTGHRVRVSAQLIDARNDTHLWAEHYDRDVADVFAVQTEIAQQIADQLKANLSPAEKAAIAERPTADLVAYAYYTKAKEIDIYSNWKGAENEKAAKQKVELLEKATQRDPNFTLAYCALAKAQLDVGNFELAKKSAETALRLRPDLVEPHLALARYCWLTPDSVIGADVDREAYYDRARDELAIVRRKLPNNAEALLIEAVIGRHQNRWDASLANLQKASELDPRNGEVAFRLEQIYFEMRRYSELEQFIRKQAPPRAGLEDPFDWLARMKLAQGDPVAAQSLLEQLPPEYSPGWGIWDVRFKAALYLRDYDAVNRVIAATPAGEADDTFGGPSGWAEGLVARARGDKQKAIAAFAVARKKMQATPPDKQDVVYFAGVAKLDAGLGRKEQAIREARRAVELQPITKDSLAGPDWVGNLALVYAWTGERDRALEQLEIVATLPGYGPTYGDLLLNPCWDDLRGDMRFDKIVAAAKAASRYALEPLPEKSIAVLPLQNLSDEKENAFFAAGIHDELLSNLSKIADLKVVSRTSVMQYKSGKPRNIREIGQQLGVAHVLEGSVQRTGNRVKVSAQLIDARSDVHLWGQTYHRDLTDVFAIQSEIAKTIADQLHAKLSPAEKAAIEEGPTADPVAYAYYTEAMNSWSDWEGQDKSLNRQVELLEKATQRDPNFALAYCSLATTQADLFDATQDRKHLELAKTAAEAAVRLRPDLGETHLALARNYFWAGLPTGDYDRARDELTIALRKLPNNSEALLIGAKIDRHQNRWDSALANLQKANGLDPRNGEVSVWLGQTYFEMRRYSEWEQLVKEYVASGTFKGPWVQVVLAKIKLAQGDPVAAQSLLQRVPLDFSPNEIIWDTRFRAALYLHNYDAANQVIAAAPAKFAVLTFGGGQPPESWADGLIARARGDKQKAQALFAAVRKKWDVTWGNKPKDEGYVADVARLDAALGRKEEAIREARSVVDRVPIAKDSLNAPAWIANLALVYAWTGERDRALEQLEKVATIPGLGPTYGDLLLNPCWDDLRGDKRFDKIVAAAKAASK